MANEIAIIKKENVELIVQSAPQSFAENKVSHDRCMEAGESLLSAIRQNGMDDVFDQKAAFFIEKARNTVRKMNEKRSGVTKLFDEIRTVFTAMEGEVDPAKKGTVPYELQQIRNAYAAKKHAVEEVRRKAEYERQQAEAARTQMKQDVEDDFNRQFTALINQTVRNLTTLDGSVALDNYDFVFDQISNFGIDLPEEWLCNLHTLISKPASITVEELRKVETETKERLGKKFKDMYATEIKDNIDYIIERLPSKKANLERMAQSSAAEAARIKAEMEERRRKEAEAMEAERRRKEEAERQKAELARQQTEMNSLFAQQASVQGYQIANIDETAILDVLLYEAGTQSEEHDS